MATRTTSKKVTASSEAKYRFILSALLIALASISLLLAQGSMWVKHTIFNQNEFKSIAVSTLSQLQNRDAIARTVVDATLADRPIVQRLAGDRLASFTSGLLASDIGERAISGVITKLYAYVTNPNPQDVRLELTVIKQPLSVLAQLAQSSNDNLMNFNSEDIPETLVLVRAADIPNVSGIYRAFIWLAPLFWLLTAVLFGTYIYLHRAVYARYVYHVYVAIATVALIGLFFGPFIPQSVGSMVANSSSSQVVTNLVSAYLAPFSQQMWTMLGAATIAIIIFWQRGRIGHGVQLVAKKLSSQRGDK